MTLSEKEIKTITDFLKLKTGIHIENDKFKKFYSGKLEKILKEEGYTSFSNFYNDLIYDKNSRLLQKIYNNTRTYQKKTP